MITLKHAFTLCGIDDNQIVFLRRRGQTRHSASIMTGGAVRNKLDMKAIKVTGIDIRCSYGSIDGFEFEVIGL